MDTPDRLARNYVHQMLLLKEFEQHGCQVEFLDWPMSQDPHDQSLLQIRGAVAEYERTLITERMRRGRLAKLRAGGAAALDLGALWLPTALRSTTRPERGNEPAEAAVVAEILARFLSTIHESVPEFQQFSEPVAPVVPM
ncbi:MAG: pinR [Polaromonas sp.]|nr:pinR [Polaromonas sp.]